MSPMPSQPVASASVPAFRRKALLQYGNLDGTFKQVDYSNYNLEQIYLCAESDNLDPVDHCRRAVETARLLPKGATLVINSEHYGAGKNVSVACDCIAACKKANSSLALSAYCMEQSLPTWDAIGQGALKRRTSVSTVLSTTRALKDAGATFASIDAYVRMARATLGVVDYLSSSWRDCWNVYVGQAATIVEPLLPPVLWISNRVHANGLRLVDNAIEPMMPAEDFMKMFLYAENRGWSSISLLGWSDTLKERTGRGWISPMEGDTRCLNALKHTQPPATT